MRHSILHALSRGSFLAFAISLTAVFPTTPVFGQTCDVEVNQNDPMAPYQTIQSGIDAALEGDVVCVHPGTYIESVTLEKTITLRSLEGPALTVLKTTDLVGLLPGVLIQNGASPRLIGFQIRDFYNGIEVRSDGDSILIANNLIVENRKSGILFDPATTSPGIGVINNTIAKHPGHGLDLTTSSSLSLTNCYNCLFIENNLVFPTRQNHGFLDLEAGYNFSDRSVFEELGPNSIKNMDPLVDSGDAYRFTSDSSPAIDAGRPSSTDNDPDGSRSDIGAWGGRNSRGWYRGPFGGPTLQDVSLTSRQVQPGDTITIRATARTD